RLAGQRAHLALAAEHRRRQRNRHARVEVASLALELRVRRLHDAQIEVACLGATRSLFAFAGDAHSGAVVQAGRNPHVDGALVAIVLDREAACCAVVEILEAEVDLLLDVAAGAGARARTALAASRSARARTSAAEEGLEEVGERVLAPEHLVHFFLRHRAVAAAAAATAEIDVPAARALARIEALARGLLVLPPVRAELVVLLALVGVAEDLVGLVDLLELRLGGLVARIDVRVMLAGQLAE